MMRYILALLALLIPGATFTCTNTTAACVVIADPSGGHSIADITGCTFNGPGVGPSAAAPAVYPADVISGAVNAYGTRKLHQVYGGNAISALRQDNSSTANIGFGASGAADNSTLSTFCSGLNQTYNGQYCVATKLFDQIGTCDMPANVNWGLSSGGVFPTTGNSYTFIASSVAGAESGYSTVSCLNYNATAFSAVFLTATISSATTYPYIFTLTTTPTAGNLNLTGSGACGLYGTVNNHLTALFPQQAWVSGVSMGPSLSTGMFYSCGGQTHALGTPYTNSYTIANFSMNAVGASNMQFLAAIFYNRAISSTEFATVQASLLQAYGLPAALPNGAIVCVGDSRTEGVGTTIGNDTWCNMLMSDASASTKYYNAAHSGYTCTQMYADYATGAANAYNVANTDNIINLWCGANDLNQGASEATIYGAISNYVTAAHATGFKVVCATELYERTWTAGMTPYTTATALNSAILGNAAGCDAIANLQSAPNIGGTTGPNSTYSPDGLHLLDIGYQIVASYFRAADQTICSAC